MPSYYEWSSRKRQKSNKVECPSFEVSSHPLKVNVVLLKQSASKNFMENLNKWSAALDEVDPLLRFEQMEQMNLEEDSSPTEDQVELINYVRTWNSRRTTILNKYTTGEKLTIVSSFLPGDEKALIRQVSNLNEKVKHRLEQLDDFDESSIRKTMGLSQQEYVSKINMLNDEIKKAWDIEQRVKAFKIAIQCSKLLSDISVMQFYPSKFVLITDILNNFGNLVFLRLKVKSFGNKDIKNIQDIDSRNVPEAAKDTCQNWIFKMASIRELLPRVFMEIALLKCLVFISNDEIKPAIARLTTMIRGIGNPLVAVYVRLYLCQVASSLYNSGCEEYFYSNLKEFLDDYRRIFNSAMKKKHESQLITLDKYLSLYMPAFSWLLYGTLNSNRCKLTMLEELLHQCERMENNELFLCSLVAAYDSDSIVKKSHQILDMIQKSSDKMVMIQEVLTPLGEHLCSATQLSHKSSEALVQCWWKVAASIKTTTSFLQGLEPWMQFSCTHLTTSHVNIILRGVIRYMSKCGQPAVEFSGQFQFIIKRMLKHIPDVEELFLMDAFMPMVELVQTSNARTLMAKTVVSIFFERYTSCQIEDHIVITNLMRLCCILHDSITAVSVEDEMKACSELINKFVQAVTYHEDTERQLNFYVECRSAFIKLDAVMVALVHCVNTLATKASGKWVQRACTAYCFVTVPSLHCALNKAQLYLLCGQTALLNCCIGQAEANFKALISLIPDIPEFVVEDGQKKLTHIKVAGLLSDLLSTLLIMPDNVDSKCKAYILSGLIKTMERIHWRKSDPLYYNTLLRILDLLSEMTQEKYPYHIEAVISNDKLYGSETEFIQVLEKYSTNICQELLVVLKALGDAKETKKQHNLALEVLWRVVRRGNLSEPPMMSLAANLWMLAQRISDSNSKLAQSMLKALEGDRSEPSQLLLQKLQARN